MDQRGTRSHVTSSSPWDALVAGHAAIAVRNQANAQRLFEAVAGSAAPSYVARTWLRRVRKAHKLVSQLGWRRDEPVQRSYPGEEPALLTRAVELAAEHGTSLSTFAEHLRLPLPLLRSVLGEVVQRPRLTLVQ